MGRAGRKRSNKTNKSEALDHEGSTIRLKKFMSRNGFHAGIPLNLRRFSRTGRGVAAGKSLKENDIIMSVPYDLLVTYTTIESLRYVELFAPRCRLIMQDLLTVFLVVERHKKNSFWGDYIGSLPVEAPWTPALLPEACMDVLPVDLKTAARRTQRLVQESWQRLRTSLRKEWVCGCCGKKAEWFLDWKTFTWGYGLVNTRAVYVNPDLVACRSKSILSGDPSMALCPYLDMFNHSYTARTQAQFVTNSGKLFLELRTLTPVQKHQQVFISYGPHDNIQLLAEYGFFIPGNGNDFIAFTSKDIVEILNLSLATSRFRFLKKHKLDSDFGLYVNEAGPSFNLRGFLFVGCCSCEDRCVAEVVFNDLYDEAVLKRINACCVKLLQSEFDGLVKIFEKIQTLCKVPVLGDFLTYRLTFIAELINNCSRKIF